MCVCVCVCVCGVVWCVFFSLICQSVEARNIQLFPNVMQWVKGRKIAPETMCSHFKVIFKMLEQFIEKLQREYREFSYTHNQFFCVFSFLSWCFLHNFSMVKNCLRVVHIELRGKMKEAVIWIIPDQKTILSERYR